MTRADLQVEVGRFLGYGSGNTDLGDAAWSDKQTSRVNESIRSGCRKFYFAPGVSWTFLKPTATITLASGASTVDMPDDFAEPEGEVIIASLGDWTCRVPITGIGRVLEMQNANTEATGQPKCVAFAPIKGTTSLEGQRKRMLVYPTADEAYSLIVRYYILPNALTDQQPFHYGGAQHAETILYACLSAAEMLEDNQPGPMSAEFARLLQASIDFDKKGAPKTFGFNADHSDGYGWGGRGAYTVTLDGVTPGA